MVSSGGVSVYVSVLLHEITQYKNEKPTNWDYTHTQTYTQPHIIIHNLPPLSLHKHTQNTRPKSNLRQFWYRVGPLPTSWTDQQQPVAIKDFMSTVGSTTDIPESSMDVFELLFSNDLQEEIVRESNRYAKQVMGDQQYQSWQPLQWIN